VVEFTLLVILFTIRAMMATTRINIRIYEVLSALGARITSVGHDKHVHGQVEEGCWAGCMCFYVI